MIYFIAYAIIAVIVAFVLEVLDVAQRVDLRGMGIAIGIAWPVAAIIFTLVLVVSRVVKLWDVAVRKSVDRLTYIERVKRELGVDK